MTLLDPELQARIRGLSLQAKRAVEGLLSGVHRSPHRGASVVFVEHRDYRPGDELRLLDWRAYARTDRDVVKRFEQETQLRASLILDCSGSMAFGDGDSHKRTYGATLLAALAHLLISQGDAAGAFRIDDHLGETLPARSKPSHLEHILRILVPEGEASAPTDLSAALRSVAERVQRRGLVVLASDLLDFSPGAFAPLGQLVARGHEVWVLHVMHRHELALQPSGPVRFVGTEGEPAIDIDVEEMRAAYDDELRGFLRTCRAQVMASGARYFLAPTDVPHGEALSALLRHAQRKGWR